MRVRNLFCASVVTAVVLQVVPAAAAPVAGASSLLTVGPQVFLEACRADVAKARAAADRFKATNAGRDELATLEQVPTRQSDC